MHDVRRILDANANRAREALRVMEEAARFLLDDADLAAGLKAARHDLARLHPAGPGALHRDTPGDVGTDLTTAGERTRASAGDVARAAGRRLAEALRVLEEYGKTRDAATAAAVEGLRYRGYELERRLLLALRARGPQWRLCVLLGAAACGGRPWREVAEAVCAAAPDCIQMREKGLDDRALLERARVLRSLAGPGTALVVNDRPDVALAAGADGVHLGQGDLPCADVRRMAGPDLLIGVSTSRLDEAKAARRDGADYCGIGPMFPSPTKAKPVLAGPAYARAYTAWNGLPHLAIGGITTENVAELRAAGVTGIAVSAAVCGAPDVAKAVRALKAAMEGKGTKERSDERNIAPAPGDDRRAG